MPFAKGDKLDGPVVPSSVLAKTREAKSQVWLPFHLAFFVQSPLEKGTKESKGIHLLLSLVFHLNPLSKGDKGHKLDPLSCPQRKKGTKGIN